MKTPTEAALAFIDQQVAKRRPWDALFQEVSDYTRAVRPEFTSPTAKGSNPLDYIYDLTAPWAQEQFANGLHSMLSSALSRWFGLEHKDLAIRQRRDMIEWRDNAVEIMYDLLNSDKSGFHPSVLEVYADVGSVGYGVLYSEYDDDARGIVYHARFPGEVYIVDDARGRAVGVVRKYKLNMQQFVDEFGKERLPKVDQGAFAQGQNLGKEFEICHLVLPATHAVMKQFTLPKGYPYGSVRICKEAEGKDPLSVGKYRSMPFHVARWMRRAGDPYGGSCGITSLPAIRRANAMTRDLIVVAHKMAEPPTQGPDDERGAPDLSPGAHNYYRPGQDDRVEIINTMGDPTFAVNLLKQTQEEIVRAYYVEAFLTTNDSNGQNVKATFVMQRRNERFRQLTSMLSRLEREFLGSVVERTLDVALEEKLIPEPPVQTALEVQYLSPIARAQRGEIVDGVLQTLDVLGPFAQVNPRIFGVFNELALAEFVGRDVNALPARLFKTPEEMQQQDEAAATANQTQQALMQSEVARNSAAAVKDVSQADFNALPQ